VVAGRPREHPHSSLSVRRALTPPRGRRERVPWIPIGIRCSR
jgi:hypothetical protein